MDVKWPGNDGVGLLLSGKFVLIFTLKMQGFMHFYCEKLLVARNMDREDLD